MKKSTSVNKSWTYLSATVAVLSLATAVNAKITAISTPITPVDAALTANGWVGVQISLVADGVNETVAGFDFANAAVAGGVGVTGTIGISGPIEQKWITKKSTGAEVSTPIGNLGNEVDPTDPSTNPDDSYWYNAIPDGDQYASITNLTENNNKANLSPGQNNLIVGFTASPEADIPFTSTSNGVDYGVGSLMTLVATVSPPDESSTLDVAYVVAPLNIIYPEDDTFINTINGGPEVPVTIKGMAFDNFGQQFPINMVINVFPVPEPVSLGLLSFGSVSLLLRRKKR